jgi:hypothetical protein
VRASKQERREGVAPLAQFIAFDANACQFAVRRVENDIQVSCALCHSLWIMGGQTSAHGVADD